MNEFKTRPDLLLAYLEGYIGNPRHKQRDVIHLYARALAYVEPAHPTFWRDLNKAIIVRWSVSGLKRIKHQSWDALERWHRELADENERLAFEDET